MSNIEISSKNNKFLVLILVGAIIILLMSAFGCAPRKYIYKIYFEDGTNEYYELTYKLKDGCKVIEYEDETIFGVDGFELLK